MSLNNLAIRLSEAGRRGEALRAAQEGASLYRDLAEANAAAYTPGLAMSLSNLAVRLSEAGRRGEALRAAQEGASLYRDVEKDIMTLTPAETRYPIITPISSRVTEERTACPTSNTTVITIPEPMADAM